MINLPSNLPSIIEGSGSSTPSDALDGFRWVEVYVNGEWTALDTFENYSIKMDSSFFTENPTEIKAPISKAIELPLTDKNAFIFGIDINAPQKVEDLQYRITNGDTAFSEGTMRVDSFRWNGLNNMVSVQFEDVVAKMVRDLKKANVSEFISDAENTTDYYHHWNVNGIGEPDMASLNTSSTKMIYPYQNTLGDGFENFIYTHRPDFDFDLGVGTQSLQPAYNVKNILESMFSHVGLNWRSEAFDDNVYTGDRGNHAYPMSNLWMSLPCRWIANTSDDWSSSLVLGGDTPTERRSFTLEFSRAYYSPQDDMIFGEATLAQSGTPQWKWMLANEMEPYSPQGYSPSNFDHFAIVNSVVQQSGNNGAAKPAYVINRPARYGFNFGGFTAPAFTIKAFNRNNSQQWSQFSQIDITDNTGGAGAPFYWQLVIMVGNRVKRFRVSQYIYASVVTQNGKQVLSLPATTIATTAIDNAEQYVDVNDTERITFYLLPVSAAQTKLQYGNQEWYGTEVTANVDPDFKLGYTYNTTFPQGAMFNVDMSPQEDTFPIVADEIPNVKESLRAAYPDMKMWDLMSLILKRFNLQLFYDVETGEVVVDNVYRNGWKQNVDLANEISAYHLFDNSQPISADVRANSIRLVNATNQSYLSVGDKAVGTDKSVASTIDYELDPDGDRDVKIDLKSGVYTGRVHGEVKTNFDDRTHEVNELTLAGAAFVQEAKTDNYGIRFGFLGAANIGDDFTPLTILTPRAIRKEGATNEWENRASYLATGQLDALKVSYKYEYYDVEIELDYIISCGMESGAGSGSDHSAYSLFHAPMYEVMHKTPKLKCSFVLNIEDLYDLKLGAVLDFGLGLFGLTSIGSIEVIEGKTKAEVEGYIL